MAVDVSNIVNFLYELVFNVSFILQIGIGIYLLYNLLGVAAFAGLGVMILLKIQSGFLAYQWEKIEVRFFRERFEV